MVEYVKQKDQIVSAKILVTETLDDYDLTTGTCKLVRQLADFCILNGDLFIVLLVNTELDDRLSWLTYLLSQLPCVMAF